MSRREQSAPFFSISALARSTIPGVQNPHCNAPFDANTRAYRSRSASGSPSSVVTSRPAVLVSVV